MTTPDDESLQDNVDFIKKFCGPQVEVSYELPSIHESLGLRIGDNDSLCDLEAALKAGIAAAVQAVRQHQADNNGYISWKGLQRIFDGHRQWRPFDFS